MATIHGEDPQARGFILGFIHPDGTCSEPAVEFCRPRRILKVFPNDITRSARRPGGVRFNSHSMTGTPHFVAFSSVRPFTIFGATSHPTSREARDGKSSLFIHLKSFVFGPGLDLKSHHPALALLRRVSVEDQ
jgi:hypothetical protein